MERGGHGDRRSLASELGGGAGDRLCYLERLLALSGYRADQCPRSATAATAAIVLNSRT
jgi:hypothetical protein